MLQSIFTAVTTQDWRYLAMGALILVSLAVRKHGQRHLPRLEHGKWAWTTTIFLGIFGGIANEFLVKHTISWDVISQGLLTGLAATGAFKGIKEWLDPTPPSTAPIHTIRLTK